MALVDFPDNKASDPGAVEIILRAARLGLFTAGEAGLLIDRVRPHPTTPQLSIEDGRPAGPGGRMGSMLISPDRTLS